MIELLVQDLQILLEICAEILNAIEDLLEVFLDDCKDSRQLNISESWNNVVSNSVILISNQDWELYI